MKKVGTRRCTAPVGGTIVETGSMAALFERHRPEAVFHLAGVLSTTAEANPDLAHRVNLEGTTNLFALARETAAKRGASVRFLFPSSIAVYGLPDAEHKRAAGAVREGEWVAPAGAYGCHKVCGEILGTYWTRRAARERAPGLDFRAIRFPGLISAETLPSGGTSDFAPEMIHAAAQGKPYSCFVSAESRIPFMTIMRCLDMKDGRVVKGVHFVNIKDAGDPVVNAEFYQKEGADELAMLDIAATLENRKTRLAWVKSVSSVIDIPLTVGGGIGSLDHIAMVLDAGADRVSMNSAAVKTPELVRQASHKFGRDKIVVAIDGRGNKAMPSGFEVVVSGGTKPVGTDAGLWAKECQELGAGIILPTSMDGDGTQAGYDLPFTRAIADAVDLPVIASGGAGRLEHFYEGAVKGGADILLAASVFHFRILSIRQVKDYLRSKGLQVAG